MGHEHLNITDPSQQVYFTTLNITQNCVLFDTTALLALTLLLLPTILVDYYRDSTDPIHKTYNRRREKRKYHNGSVEYGKQCTNPLHNKTTQLLLLLGL